MKLFFFTTIPSPYRVDFFNEVNKLCDLFVLFEAKVDLECPRNSVSKEKLFFHYHFLSNSKGYRNLIFSGLWFVLKAKYDRLILHTWYTRTQICLIILLKVFRRKYWIETDGNILDYNESKLKKLFKCWLFRGAEGFFSSSSLSDDYFVNYGVNRKKIHRYTFTSVSKDDVLPYYLGPSSKLEIRKKLSISNNKKIILSVGRFIPIKGFDVLIKACSADWNIYIVGGEATTDYIQITKNYGLEDNIHFVKFCSKKELSDYYKAADLFVLPTRGDSWGLVVNEAMSYGLPVITTDKCGAGLEVLDNQDITIVPSDNVEALKTSISKLLENEILRKKIGNRNLEYSQSHTIEIMAKDHIFIE